MGLVKRRRRETMTAPSEKGTLKPIQGTRVNGSGWHDLQMYFSWRRSQYMKFCLQIYLKHWRIGSDETLSIKDKGLARILEANCAAQKVLWRTWKQIFN
jgi:hypothetical protein